MINRVPVADPGILDMLATVEEALRRGLDRLIDLERRVHALETPRCVDLIAPTREAPPEPAGPLHITWTPEPAPALEPSVPFVIVSDRQ